MGRRGRKGTENIRYTIKFLCIRLDNMSCASKTGAHNTGPIYTEGWNRGLNLRQSANSRGRLFEVYGIYSIFECLQDGSKQTSVAIMVYDLVI